MAGSPCQADYCLRKVLAHHRFQVGVNTCYPVVFGGEPAECLGYPEAACFWSSSDLK